MLLLDIDSKNLKPPYLIHSDLFRAFSFIKEAYKESKEDVNPSELHFDVLCQIFGKENLILPSFNYDFPKSKIYDTKNTSSQVGTLTNYVLENSLLCRTKTPIFSFLTDIPELLLEHSYPFSSGSVFDYLYVNDGSVVFYGTDITSCTYLHFIENQFGPPLFRYDKNFGGTIIDKGIYKDCFVQFHVRPHGMELDYNWNFLYQLLIQKDVVVNLSNNCFAVKARNISRIWGELFVKDPFEILSKESKIIVKTHVDKIGRRLIQSDFESM